MHGGGGGSATKKPLTDGIVYTSTGIKRFDVATGIELTFKATGFFQIRLISESDFVSGTTCVIAVLRNGTKISRAVCTGVNLSYTMNKSVGNISGYAETDDVIKIINDTSAPSTATGRVYFSLDTTVNDDTFFYEI